MEEYDNEAWIWLDVEPNTDNCVFCGEVEHNNHLSSCPSNIISVHEGAVSMWTRLYDDNRTEDEYHSDVGKQLMFSADLIIQAQKEWSRKSILAKMDEVFNNWGVITDFAEVLLELGIVQSSTEVIDYYKNPTMYEKEFFIWTEYDYPFPDDDSWHEFKSRLNLPNNEGFEI